MPILRNDSRSIFVSQRWQQADAPRFSVTQLLTIFLLFCLAAALAHAQSFTTLVIFDETNGGTPSWPLFQGTDGNFYGSTGYGGTGFEGTIFKTTPSGKLTTLQSLDYPHLSVRASHGGYYGTTVSGGPLEAGTVFKVTSAGKFTTLYYFCSLANCLDGDDPIGGVIQGTDGNFYGTTAGGGTFNYGTIFKITPKGGLTTLYSFS